MAKLAHVVWDWNGTLVDDLPVVVEAARMPVASSLVEAVETAADPR